MKAWRLLKGNRVLEILEVDPETREVKRVVPLSLRLPMTNSEAQSYMESHYPHVSPREHALEKDLA